MNKQTLPIEHLARLRRIRGLARLMDTALRIPGTRVSFGADSVLGLIPGIGDLGASAVSLIIVNEARRLGVPNDKLLKMLINVGFDAVAGSGQCWATSSTSISNPTAAICSLCWITSVSITLTLTDKEVTCGAVHANGFSDEHSADAFSEIPGAVASRAARACRSLERAEHPVRPSL
jgi:hypothetical protein